jgi:ubiquinone/menaquinone biosynthesis C-methylase UbiE
VQKIIQGDAEEIPFADDSFDFVWSWGVIHHSAHTSRIVRQISRILVPDGETRIMIYNREGASAMYVLIFKYLLSGGFINNSLENLLYKYTDGFSARFYVQEHFEDMMRGFFKDVKSIICGLPSDAVPLPRAIRNLILPNISEEVLRHNQSNWGSFIFVTAKNRL